MLKVISSNLRFLRAFLCLGLSFSVGHSVDAQHSPTDPSLSPNPSSRWQRKYIEKRTAVIAKGIGIRHELFRISREEESSFTVTFFEEEEGLSELLFERIQFAEKAEYLKLVDAKEGEYSVNVALPFAGRSYLARHTGGPQYEILLPNGQSPLEHENVSDEAAVVISSAAPLLRWHDLVGAIATQGLVPGRQYDLDPATATEVINIRREYDTPYRSASMRFKGGEVIAGKKVLRFDVNFVTSWTAPEKIADEGEMMGVDESFSEHSAMQGIFRVDPDTFLPVELSVSGKRLLEIPDRCVLLPLRVGNTYHGYEREGAEKAFVEVEFEWTVKSRAQ